MEQCSLDLISFKLETDHQVFLFGDRADFFPTACTRYFRRSEIFFLCNHKKVFSTIAMSPYMFV